MERKIRPRRIADVFHDVHLARVGPSPGAQGPERRPESRARGQLDARRGSSIRKLALRSRFQPARYEVKCPALWCFEARTMTRPNDERTVVCTERFPSITHGHRVGRVDVCLLLVVDGAS